MIKKKSVSIAGTYSNIIKATYSKKTIRTNNEFIKVTGHNIQKFVAFLHTNKYQQEEIFKILFK